MRGRRVGARTNQIDEGPQAVALLHSAATTQSAVNGDFFFREARRCSYAEGRRLTPTKQASFRVVFNELSRNTKAVPAIVSGVAYVTRTTESKPEVTMAVNLGYHRRLTNKSPHLNLLTFWKVVNKPVGKT